MKRKKCNHPWAKRIRVGYAKGKYYFRCYQCRDIITDDRMSNRHSKPIKETNVIVRWWRKLLYGL